MHKLIDTHFKKQFKAYLNQYYPQFLPSKKDMKILSGTYFSGCDVYEWKVNAEKKAWLIAGGVKDRDRDITVAIAWTQTSASLKDDCVKLWRKSECISPPSNGLLMLIDDELVGDDLLNGERWLTINEPTNIQQQEALEAYVLTPLYQRVREIGAVMLRKKLINITDEEIDRQIRLDSRAFFPLWIEVAKYLPLTEKQLDDVVQPVLDRVFYFISEYAISFLAERIRS